MTSAPQVMDYAPCQFDPSKRNYDAFAQFYKIIPVITPDLRIYAMGPGGILCQIEETEYASPHQSAAGSGFCKWFGTVSTPHTNDGWKMDVTPVKFVPNMSLNILEGEMKIFPGEISYARLYPVPFSAAKGLPDPGWLGQSCSVNIAADDTLLSRLDKVANDLQMSDIASWGYSSDNLPDGWTPDGPYLPTGFRPHYFGLFDRPKDAPSEWKHAI